MRIMSKILLIGLSYQQDVDIYDLDFETFVPLVPLEISGHWKERGPSSPIVQVFLGRTWWSS